MKKRTRPDPAKDHPIVLLARRCINGDLASGSVNQEAVAELKSALDTIVGAKDMRPGILAAIDLLRDVIRLDNQEALKALFPIIFPRAAMLNGMNRERRKGRLKKDVKISPTGFSNGLTAPGMEPRGFGFSNR